MTDRIVLQGISARGFHGVLGVEKAEGQDFVVDVTLQVDLRRAGRSDLLCPASLANPKPGSRIS